jgi:UDP-N-acetylglucosamine 2-epimerase (non-hydrolysing)
MRLTTLFGTRPETIKLAPLIKEGIEQGHDVKVIFTGQHREMALPLLNFFGIKPDHDLNVMRPNQDLSSLTSLMLKLLDENPELKNTDALMVQGDTTSAYIGAYWAFLNKIPVIHLEAGLRTYNIHSPFPEEANRQLISRIAKVHFAPTTNALQSLHREGITKNTHMIGNTGIDALRIACEKVSDRNLPIDIIDFIDDRRVVLITGHRRENFGEGMKQISIALKALSLSRPNVCFIYPLHMNPNVLEVMKKELRGLPNLLLTDPIPYLPFIALMKKASVILTDSGGIQEEAPTLRVPVIVMRDTTERPEGVALGYSILVGTDPEKICAAVMHALEKGCEGRGENPFGDGRSSQKAWSILTEMKEQ